MSTIDSSRATDREVFFEKLKRKTAGARKTLAAIQNDPSEFIPDDEDDSGEQLTAPLMGSKPKPKYMEIDDAAQLSQIITAETAFDAKEAPELLLKAIGWPGTYFNGKRLPYASGMEMFLAASFELNRRRVLAPAFRNAICPPPKDLSPDDVLLSRHKQLIDLHWLMCIGGTVIIDHRKYSDLFAKWSLTRAYEFACEPVPTATKADWLGLPEKLACQVSTLKLKEQSDHFRVVMNGAGSRGQPGYHHVLNELVDQAGADPTALRRAKVMARAWACNRLATADERIAIGILAVWDGIDVDVDEFRKLIIEAHNRFPRRLSRRLAVV